MVLRQYVTVVYLVQLPAKLFEPRVACLTIFTQSLAADLTAVSRSNTYVQNRLRPYRHRECVDTAGFNKHGDDDS